MQNRSKSKNIPVQQVITALLDDHNVFPVAYLHSFSDLEGADLEKVRSAWPQVNPSRRYSLLEDLVELTEADTLVSFNAIGRMALTDPEPGVRAAAIRLLEEDEGTDLVPILIEMMENDQDAEVRSTAAAGLGVYVYHGELEEISEKVLQQAVDHLLTVVGSDDVAMVRRKALESLGFSSNDQVPPLIQHAYDSKDADWMASALIAMGRSADQAWGKDVIRMLQYPNGNVQVEAVRAAGELNLANARRALLDLLEEEAQDAEMREAVIWALSQIGGDNVRDTLETLLEETDDEAELEILENALDNLTFTEDVDIFGMFDFAGMGERPEDQENPEEVLEQFLREEEFDNEDENASDDSEDQEDKDARN